MKEKVTLEEKKMYFTMALSLYMTEHNIANEDMQFLIPRLFLVLYDVDDYLRIDTVEVSQDWKEVKVKAKSIDSLTFTVLGLIQVLGKEG